ncbi:MAG: matrixin family metalloprotease [Nitrososphaerota archaeon]
MRNIAIAVPFLAILIFLPVNIIAQGPVNSTSTVFPWDIKLGKTLPVMINASPSISSEKIDVVKNAITSENYFIKDGKKFYEGWKGALAEASVGETKHVIPTLKIVESSPSSEIISITLITTKDNDGYAGYTKFITINHKIYNSNITIYGVDELTNEELEGIIRHEFGHALGLGHSTMYGDLMHEHIDVRSAFISECNVHAIHALYDGEILTQHFEKTEI